jgi:Cytochrome P460
VTSIDVKQVRFDSVISCSAYDDLSAVGAHSTPIKVYGRIAMRGKVLTITGLAACGAIATAVFAQTPSNKQRYPPEYTTSGDLILPKNWREWVYVGSPLTPIALNGGKACPEEPTSSSSGPCTGFPEYHNVYIEPGSYEIYKRTNEFPEGTIMFKELQLTLPGQNPDGSRTEPSGRGYFPGHFNGADVTVKDTKRYADTNGWGYYNFNHHEPKAPTSKVRAKEECAYCHIGLGAKKDDVWTQFYPLLDK